MDNDPDPEGWNRLSERARWGLEHPDQFSPLNGPPNLTLQIRLWSYPHRGPHRSWGLFLPLWHDSQALVREMRWNAPADRRRMGSSLALLKRRQVERPTLRFRDAMVDAPRLAPFLLEAPEMLSMWAPRAPRAGESGQETLGLEGYRSLSHARIDWAEGDEDSAEGAVAWAMRLRHLLRGSLSEKETA